MPKTICVHCGQPGRKTRSDKLSPADHDQRVLSAVAPDRSWREIVRESRLSVADATRARKRLIAEGRLVQTAASVGPVGARYRVP